LAFDGVSEGKLFATFQRTAMILRNFEIDKPTYTASHPT